MRIIRDFPAFGGAEVALAIGNFDGVHSGHRRLLAAVRAAAAAPLRPAAMTFEPHPLAVLRPQAPLARLCSSAEKMRLLRACDMEMLFVPRFNRELAALPAEEFAQHLFARLRVRHLVIGENFRFGSGGRGNLHTLQAAAAAHGAQVQPVPLQAHAGAPISSGRVRQALHDGDFVLAEALLGRPWQLRGRVVRGKALARQWGFPTANLAITFNPPLRGIFAAQAQVGGQRHTAAMSIGTNPTVSSSSAVRVEAHLLDVDADLYGASMRLQPLHKLRDERKFDSIAELKEAMAQDIAATRACA